MILNNNHNDSEIRRQVDEALGKPYSLLERIKQGGIGSGRLLIHDASEPLANCLAKDHDLKYASMELRPKGIILYLRNKINEYMWIIPYYKLSIYKSDWFSVHADGMRMRFHVKSVYPYNAKFVSKLMDRKAQHSIPSPLDQTL